MTQENNQESETSGQDTSHEDTAETKATDNNPAMKCFLGTTIAYYSLQAFTYLGINAFETPGRQDACLAGVADAINQTSTHEHEYESVPFWKGTLAIATTMGQFAFLLPGGLSALKGGKIMGEAESSREMARGAAYVVLGTAVSVSGALADVYFAKDPIQALSLYGEYRYGHNSTNTSDPQALCISGEVSKTVTKGLDIATVGLNAGFGLLAATLGFLGSRKRQQQQSQQQQPLLTAAADIQDPLRHSIHVTR